MDIKDLKKTISQERFKNTNNLIIPGAAKQNIKMLLIYMSDHPVNPVLLSGP